MKIVIAVLCICVASTPGFAQESPAPVKLSPEQQAIRANAEAFVAAFNQGDAKAVSALWAEEGEMSLDGEPVAVGRVEVAAKYAEYFAENEGASIQIEIDSIRVLGPNLAVERGRSEVVNDDDDTAVDAYRLVYTRVDDAWLIATADVQQEFFEAPYDWKNELEFLIGKWKAQDGDWSVETEFEWAPGGNFLKRTFSINDGTQDQRTGTQVIGWDARNQTITSWMFGTDGGHGRGWWSRHDDHQWLIESEGVSAEGEIVTTTNIITMLDNDSFRWQSTNRSVEGVSLPDTDSVRVNRVRSDQ